MFRRVVSLLMLPCVLLTQAAAFGHTHGGSQPAGHDLRPHFHTNPAPAGHKHGHHQHGPGGQHHHHDDADAEPEPQPTTTPERQPDHDSDAVFVATVDFVASERALADEELTASVLLPAACWDALALDLIRLPHEGASWRPPPLAIACPIYVRYLALLI